MNENNRYFPNSLACGVSFSAMYNAVTKIISFLTLTIFNSTWGFYLANFNAINRNTIIVFVL